MAPVLSLADLNHYNHMSLQPVGYYEPSQLPICRWILGQRLRSRPAKSTLAGRYETIKHQIAACILEHTCRADRCAAKRETKCTDQEDTVPVIEPAVERVAMQMHPAVPVSQLQRVATCFYLRIAAWVLIVFLRGIFRG